MWQRKTLNWARTTYDRDGDGFVSRKEFTSGYGEFRCDGQYANFKCDNGAASYRYLPTLGMGADTDHADQIPIRTGLETLVKSNDTMLMGQRFRGGCYRRLTIAPASPTGTSTVQDIRTWKVWVDGMSASLAVSPSSGSLPLPTCRLTC